MDKRRREVLVATAVATLVFCLGLFAINTTHSSWENSITDHTRQLANTQAHELQVQIKRTLAAATILGAHIHIRDGNVHDFDELAHTIQGSLGGIANMALAPDGIIAQVHPAEGYERVISKNLLADDPSGNISRTALKTHKLVVAGPFIASNGKVSIAGRQPVFLHDLNQADNDHIDMIVEPYSEDWVLPGDRFWGFTTVLIDLENILAQTELPTLTDQEYGYRLTKINAISEKQEFISGQRELPADIIGQAFIALPNSSWFLEVAYLGKALSSVWLIALIALNILVTLLTGHWLYQLMIRPRQLQELVGRRTAQLDRKNQHLQREQLELRKFRNAVNESGNCIVITDHKGVIEYVNKRFTEVTGYSYQEAVGATPAVLKSPFTRKEEHAELWRAISHGKKWRGERRNTRKDGKYYWSLMSISPIKDASGSITHFVSVSEDITENKELQMQVEKLAYHDPLTGLSNRRHFMNQLEHRIRLSHRTQDTGAVLFMDLDHFKMINDTLGHEFGDELLKLVARKIMSCLRDSDLPARLGGDEFTVLLPKLEDEQGALRVAEKLVAMINEPLTIMGHNIQQSVSIGISIIRNSQLSARQVLRQADLALYQAKSSGRNVCRRYDDSGAHPASTSGRQGTTHAQPASTASTHSLMDPDPDGS